MNWLPPATNFRETLCLARSATAAEDRVARLVELASCRLGFVETLQVDETLRASKDLSIGALSRVRLAILSNCTVDHLASAVRVAGLRRRVLFEIHVGGFDQYRQELLDGNSPLSAFCPEFVLFSLSPRATIAGVSLGIAADDAAQLISATVADLRGLWQLARERLGATVVQQSFLDIFAPVFGGFDRFVPGAPSRLVAQLNERLADAIARDGALLLDLKPASAQDGIDAWFDQTRWLHAKMEIAPAAAPRFGELLARLIDARLGRSRKCLVLDLDDTLWGGVIGDDGLEGIVLGEGSARGEAHVEFQKYARLLKDRGVILAVCSKNDPAVAESVFNEHPEMVLRRPDIAAFVANWDDKAENLRRIAALLNIGLDSLVFVDDNPAERARIRESLPMVAVPELPADPAHYVRCIAAAGYFEAVSFTPEDQARAAHYAADANRAEFRGSSQSIDDYLRGLKMTLECGLVRSVDLARATQLIGKTNQFNTTGRRYTPEELAAICADEAGVALQFRLADRFGDNGLVSVMILKAEDGASAGVFAIDNWVMSCRVFGRQLEAEAMNVAVEELRTRGACRIYGEYVPTKKNGLIGELYRNLGFSPAPRDAARPGERWSLDLADYRAAATHFVRRTR